MSPFHFCLSAAKSLSSFQLLPASLITDLLQLFLGLPLFLFPWGFQSRPAFGISPSSFLNVWPIHPNFLFSSFYIYIFLSWFDLLTVVFIFFCDRFDGFHWFCVKNLCTKYCCKSLNNQSSGVHLIHFALIPMGKIVSVYKRPSGTN